MGTSPLLEAVLRIDATLPVGLCSCELSPLSRRNVVVGVVCVGDVSGSLRFLGVVVVMLCVE